MKRNLDYIMGCAFTALATVQSAIVFYSGGDLMGLIFAMLGFILAGIAFNSSEIKAQKIQRENELAGLLESKRQLDALISYKRNKSMRKCCSNVSDVAALQYNIDYCEVVNSIFGDLEELEEFIKKEKDGK